MEKLLLPNLEIDAIELSPDSYTSAKNEFSSRNAILMRPHYKEAPNPWTSIYFSKEYIFKIVNRNIGDYVHEHGILGVTFWLGYEKDFGLFLIARGTQKDSRIYTGNDFLVDNRAKQHGIKVADGIALQSVIKAARETNYKHVRADNAFDTFSFSIQDIIDLVAVSPEPVIPGDVNFDLIFIKDEATNLDYLTIGFNNPELALAGVPYPPICYYM